MTLPDKLRSFGHAEVTQDNMNGWGRWYAEQKTTKELIGSIGLDVFLKGQMNFITIGEKPLMVEWEEEEGGEQGARLKGGIGPVHNLLITRTSEIRRKLARGVKPPESEFTGVDVERNEVMEMIPGSMITAPALMAEGLGAHLPQVVVIGDMFTQKTSSKGRSERDRTVGFILWTRSGVEIADVSVAPKE